MGTYTAEGKVYAQLSPSWFRSGRSLTPDCDNNLKHFSCVLSLACWSRLRRRPRWIFCCLRVNVVLARCSSVEFLLINTYLKERKHFCQLSFFTIRLVGNFDRPDSHAAAHTVERTLRSADRLSCRHSWKSRLLRLKNYWITLVFSMCMPMGIRSNLKTVFLLVARGSNHFG